MDPVIITILFIFVVFTGGLIYLFNSLKEKSKHNNKRSS